jgi:two-component system CheB/CheR fusion protein
MSLHQLGDIGNYVHFLRSNPHEAQLLFKELLIGVTSFFRDPPLWEQIEAEVFPAILAAHPEGATLRAWTPACSTGEEAYSLAIAFRETLDRLKPNAHYALQIFATDLDSDAIDKARAGAYPLNIAADLSEDRLRHYFVQQEDHYKVRKEIREMVTFAPRTW